MNYELLKYCFTQYFHILVHLNVNVRTRVRTYILHGHSDIYTYNTYAFTEYSVKDDTRRYPLEREMIGCVKIN